MHLLRGVRGGSIGRNLPELRRQFRSTSDPPRASAGEISAIDGAEGAGVKPPRVLIIAGSDSGGGAGIQADIKAVTMLGGHAMTAVTAITVQNTLGVEDVFPVPDDILLKQVRAVESDLGVDVVKIGMLATEALAGVVGGLLKTRFLMRPVVLDPVIVATSGDALNEVGTAEALRSLA